MLINKVSDNTYQWNGHDVVISIGGIFFYSRDRAEGGAGGALAPPLFCKNKNELNKK